MKALLPILACLSLLTACAHQSPTAVSSAAGRATGHLEAAQQDVKDAIPHADAVGQSLLKSATGDLNVVAQQMPTFEKAANDLASANAMVAKLKHQFWSPRQVAWFWWIAGSLTALFVAFGVIDAFSGVGWVKAIGNVLAALSTLGGAIIRWISAWLTRRVFGISQAVIATSGYAAVPGSQQAPILLGK